jgi:hypothetical protein
LPLLPPLQQTTQTAQNKAARCSPYCQSLFTHASEQNMAGKPCDKWLTKFGWCGDPNPGWSSYGPMEGRPDVFFSCYGCAGHVPLALSELTREDTPLWIP